MNGGIPSLHVRWPGYADASLPSAGSDSTHTQPRLRQHRTVTVIDGAQHAVLRSDNLAVPRRPVGGTPQVFRLGHASAAGNSNLNLKSEPIEEADSKRRETSADTAIAVVNAASEDPPAEDEAASAGAPAEVEAAEVPLQCCIEFSVS